MNQPSSTITAATVAGMIMVAIWGGVNIFVLPANGYALTPDIVAWEGSVSVAVSALVGYFKPENVYPNGVPWREGSPRNPPEDTQ